MDIDERQEERENWLKDESHEMKMRNDSEYFCEYVLETLHVTPNKTKSLFLFDIVDAIKKECFKYDQDFSEFLDYLKGIWDYMFYHPITKQELELKSKEDLIHFLQSCNPLMMRNFREQYKAKYKDFEIIDFGLKVEIKKNI